MPACRSCGIVPCLPAVRQASHTCTFCSSCACGTAVHNCRSSISAVLYVVPCLAAVVLSVIPKAGVTPLQKTWSRCKASLVWQSKCSANGRSAPGSGFPAVMNTVKYNRCDVKPVNSIHYRFNSIVSPCNRIQVGGMKWLFYCVHKVMEVGTNIFQGM